jgi:ABC-type microcin C transport system duplicated ATPase subunit YejF
MEIIRWAQQRLGGAIIIIEHDMSLVKELAQIVYVLTTARCWRRAAWPRSKPIRRCARSMSEARSEPPTPQV